MKAWNKEQMKLEPPIVNFAVNQPGKRLIIMLAGIIVNLILGFFIYAIDAWHWREQYFLPIK